MGARPEPFDAAVAAAGGPLPDGLGGLAPTDLLEELKRHKLVAHSECLDPLLSAEQRAVLRPEWTGQAARSLAHLGELQRLLPAMKRAGIPVLAMKGVVLQQALHGRPVGRDHVDLDLLVAPAHFIAASRWLLDNGYALSGLLPTVLDSRLPSALPFHRADGIGLDLHRQVFAPFYAMERANRALDGLRDGEHFDVLGTDFLVMLTGGKDVWSTLRHLADIKIVHQRTDRIALAALADQTHTRKIVDTGMRLAEEVLGLTDRWPAKYPLDLSSRITALRRPRDDSRGWDRTTAYLASREHWRSRFRFLGRVPLATSYGDLQQGILSGPTRVPIRLFRLAKKYLAH